MRNLHIASSIGIISRKVPQTNNFVPTRVHLNSTMKTYTKRDKLASAAKSIVKIIEQKVHGTKDYADKPRFAAWKDAVRRVAEVVDSVRDIARITHEIPLTVIAAERFCKWHERVGRETEGHPFLKWRLIMHPDKAHFNDHPWLQTIERRFDLQRTGFQTSAFLPAAQPSSETLPKAAIRKGKEKASNAEVKAMIEDDDGEDELVDEDAEMGAASGSRQSNRQSRTPKPKLVKHKEVDELDEENHDEDMAMDMPGKAGVELAIRSSQPQTRLAQQRHPAKIVATSAPTPTCPAFANQKVHVSNAKNNPSHARSKKRSRSSSSPDDEDANDDDDEDYTTGHPQKKPRTSNNAGKLPPQSWSRPVVMIPQGRPAPDSPPLPSVPNPPSAPMPQRQPSLLFEVDVCEELNQLFQFHDTMSVQMLQVKTRLNAVNGR
ncbi:hypothetical protein BKA82DRAFT_25569 [Pisolithus tinctorius]|uniref:Uncharacterized protein n=1 Tax=Pisolithus tinctorius Marx 270 TaxID=870435 RepID=A0A0C3PBU5_PISTI|nr:hypothetical protein BKA82DRAFT_25569 [Pisolithus tinctorius]KIO05446.1 hypothetical protein M404DRAFT_25569 [Pisolithus tinctorius Marx 270]